MSTLVPVAMPVLVSYSIVLFCGAEPGYRSEMRKSYAETNSMVKACSVASQGTVVPHK